MILWILIKNEKHEKYLLVIITIFLSFRFCFLLVFCCLCLLVYCQCFQWPCIFCVHCAACTHNYVCFCLFVYHVIRCHRGWWHNVRIVCVMQRIPAAATWFSFWFLILSTGSCWINNCSFVRKNDGNYTVSQTRNDSYNYVTIFTDSN